MSTFAFGDIQGCYKEFRYLLKQCRFNSAVDNLWLVGDLINRGPDNRETLDFVMSLGDSATTVLGNHDLHFLAIARGKGSQSSSDTLGDLLEHKNLDQYVEWIRTRPMIHYDRELNCAMVHAGLPPIWSVNVCLERANEVEALLSGNNCDDFLDVMYGNEPPTWHDEIVGMDRIRLLTNFFTRMRFCRGDASLELTHKTLQAPAGYRPWFEFPRPDRTNIVFGHWAALEGNTGLPHIHALDTGCVWGRTLTAMRLEDGQLFQCPAGSG